MNVYGDTIVVRMVANSGKVKRIRNNGQINIAPCKSDGTLIGAWVVATPMKPKTGLPPGKSTTCSIRNTA